MKRLIVGGTTALLFSTGLGAAYAQNLAEFSTINNQEGQLIAQNNSRLMATDQDGTPSNFTKEQWLRAKAQVSSTAVPGSNDYRVTFQAENLVPNGLYTFWWVNPRVVGMDMGPAGGAEGNSFRADANGNATANIIVPNNDYRMLVVAYHADNKTHGEMPGKMGEITFSHLAGEFPKAQ